MERILVMVRHGQSEWNLKNLFTGWENPDLTEKGVDEARRTGRLLKEQGLTFDACYTSLLKRAQKTLDLILEEMQQTELPITCDQALNERDYGDLTGLNKADAEKQWSVEQIHQWRRSYDIPPPNGESLKDTGERTYPYFRDEILPKVMSGQSILVAAHGNSIRSLVKEIEGLSPQEILEREIATGEPTIYRYDEQGQLI